jgi:CheY-like chemotaxis protein
MGTGATPGADLDETWRTALSGLRGLAPASVWLAPSHAHFPAARLAAGGEAVVAVVRVLLVDDQEPYLRAMAAVVEETPGFEVVGRASTGEEAVELAATLTPDLVLMDVNLPGIDGLEATRQLLGPRPALVIVLLSTYDEESGAAFVAESGASAYVTKAVFGPDRLADAWTGS